MSKYGRWCYVQDFFLGGFATYGALWLIVESISAFFVSLRPEGFVWYCSLLVLAGSGGVWRAWPTNLRHRGS